MGKLYQYNLLAGDQSAIEASRFTVGSVNSNSGALQIGPDGRIYHAVFMQYHLGVVYNPSQLGAACNYIQNGLNLGGRQSYFGLPNILMPYSSITPPDDPPVTSDGDCVNVSLPNVFSPNSDGINDRFAPLCLARSRIRHTTIYDRWGQVVYSENGPPDWDGRSINGEAAPDGTYYWVLDVGRGIADTMPIAGVVTLLR